MKKQNAFLFVGGPCDGDIRAVPPGTKFVRIATPPPKDAPAARAVPSVEYVRHAIDHRGGPNGPGSVDFFAAEGLDMVDALLLVFENYKPKGKQ